MNEKKNLLVIAIVFLIVVVLWSIYQRDEGEAAPADAPALQRQTPREALRAAPRVRDLVEVPEFPVGLNLSTVDLTARSAESDPCSTQQASGSASVPAQPQPQNALVVDCILLDCRRR